MTSKILNKVQEIILQEDLVAEIEIEVITPILLGGYDTKYCHELEKDLKICEPLRASSVKGLWRWWARALLAAAANLNDITISEADKVIARLLGSSEMGTGCSKYSVVTEVVDSKFLLDISEVLREIPWIKFTRFSDRVLSPGTKCVVKLYRNKETSKVEDRFATLSLIIGLIFSGLGKATSRGFGKVKITSIKCTCDREGGIEELVNTIYTTDNPSSIEEALRKLIERGIGAAKKLLEIYGCILNGDTGRKSGKPGVPLIEVPLDKFMILKVLNRRFEDYKDALRCIGNATLKLYHKALAIYENRRKGLKKFKDVLKEAQKERGAEFHTWILGLPRAQEPTIIDVSDKPQDDVKKLVSKLREKLERKLKGLLKQTGLEEGAIERAVKELCKYVYEEKEKGKSKIRVPTGYYFIDKKGYVDKLRRKSPLRFTLISTDRTSYYVVLYGFKTSDWVEKLSRGVLLHIGAEWIRQPKTINGKRKPVTIDVKDFIVTLISVYSINTSKLIEDIGNGISRLIEEGFCLS